MTTRYGLYCEHLPDKDGERKITLGHATFDTLERAQHECDQIRRQNLPFRAWPIAVEDPRDKSGEQSDHEVAISEHAFRAGFTVAMEIVGNGASPVVNEARLQRAWSDYTPPEDLCGGGNAAR